MHQPGVTGGRTQECSTDIAACAHGRSPGHFRRKDSRGRHIEPLLFHRYDATWWFDAYALRTFSFVRTTSRASDLCPERSPVVTPAWGSYGVRRLRTIRQGRNRGEGATLECPVLMGTGHSSAQHNEK